MKKLITFILVLALALSMSVPVFAANETSAKTNLSFTSAVVTPSYTITIPSSLNLNLGATNLPITLSKLENFDDKGVLITFEGTQQSAMGGTLFVTILDPPDGVGIGLYYEIYDVSGKQLAGSGGDGPYVIPAGLSLAALDGEGTVNIKINISDSALPFIVPGATYTGHIVFGIKLITL